MPWRRHLSRAGLLVLLGLVYWPGLSGPWLFDDYSNIRDNVFLRVTFSTFPGFLAELAD